MPRPPRAGGGQEGRGAVYSPVSDLSGTRDSDGSRADCVGRLWENGAAQQVSTERAARNELAADYASTRKMLDAVNMSGSAFLSRSKPYKT
eukprot:1184134-Prorocentrum_minimum.AAC.1